MPSHRFPPIKTPGYLIEYQGVRIVLMGTSKGPQPFYRKSQKNNAKPTEWFPFDRLCPMPHSVAWFDRARYSGRIVVGTPLEHFGTEENKYISEQLMKLDEQRLLPEPVVVNKEAVNIFIGTPAALKGNLQFKAMNTEEDPTLGIRRCPDIYGVGVSYPAGLAVKIGDGSSAPSEPARPLTIISPTTRLFG
jgi:hypothetical protein